MVEYVLHHRYSTLEKCNGLLCSLNSYAGAKKIQISRQDHIIRSLKWICNSYYLNNFQEEHRRYDAHIRDYSMS